MGNIGKHVIIDMVGCPFEVLNDKGLLEKLLTESALSAGCTILSVTFHTFEPQGVTGVVIVSESHYSIHTYPELNYVAIDAFTCGSHIKPFKALKNLVKTLCPTKYKVKIINRGFD